MTFRVTDIQRAKAFYSAALAPLGYSVCFEGNYGMNILGFAPPTPPSPTAKRPTCGSSTALPYGGPPPPPAATWPGRPRPAPRWTPSRRRHRRWRQDNGAPGLRPDYHPHYYGAFVIDPEGNNIEAVCHLPG